VSGFQKGKAEVRYLKLLFLKCIIMEKLFCSYELSVKLKEFGFYEPVIAGYDIDDNKLISIVNEDGILSGVKTESLLTVIAAPLFCQVVDWLRERHKVFIQVDQKLLEMNYSPSEINYSFEIRDGQDKILYPKSTIQDSLSDYRVGTKYYHSDYYFQLNKAIEEAITLIKPLTVQ